MTKTLSVMEVINFPLTVMVGRKPFSLNLNKFRNTHYAVLAKAKENYKSLVKLPKAHYDKVRLEYTLFPKTKRRLDVSNVCSIVDKFASDMLVDAGILDDDNFDIVVEVVYRFGCIDKDNPRCELKVVELRE